ncbi:putative bifunctional diguanylate cyclase/phosphodiesterase [Methylotenera sp.]|uniref:putative bifunctional diguanylate cyclase/phosphodiesterase n=1 Tax=Methylotenera sp. TaxID=2051956 RepID=UPI002ED8005C
MLNNILVLTNDPNEAEMLKAALGQSKNLFRIEWLRHLSSGINRLRMADMDAIIVNLSLPDSSGIATFDKLFAVAPHTPILTLSLSEEATLAKEAVAHGAQGYLSRAYLESKIIPQALLNIIQRKQIEEDINQQKVRAEIALNSINDAVICTNLSAHIDYLNTSAVEMTGWSREEAYGLHINKVFNIVDGSTNQPPLENPVHLVLERNEPMGLNAGTLLIQRDGMTIPIEDSVSPIRDHNGEMTGVVIVFHDVSAAHEMAKRMEHLAQHDFLTNLPNRLLLNDRIAHAITLAQRTNTQLAVLFLDLDNFKNINDSLGHETGDKLLQSVTERLCSCVRGSDTVSRQGGDEFVILLSSGEYGVDANLTANKILKSLSLPHQIAKTTLHITTSIGISLYPADGVDAQTLIKNADTAMYDAKETGRNNYKFFRNEMNVRAVERQLIESQLRTALDKKELELYYQPKVNLNTGMITGVEALLRWNHSEWGVTATDRFINIAEDCGLIVPIGNWVIRQACLQAKQWIDTGLKPIRVAVNISAIEFHQNNFVDNIRQVLIDTGLDANYLQLEITESVLIRDAKATAKVLQQLRAMQVQIALDDFGTGYSSLSYLNQFPIDVLKIDQSFVCGIQSVTDEAIIVSAIIGMGNNLKLCVVAEGVENQIQLDFLKVKHCKEGQGNYFSPPLKADNFAKLLTINKSELAEA